MSESNADLEMEYLMSLFAETVFDDDEPDKSVTDLEIEFLEA